MSVIMKLERSHRSTAIASWILLVLWIQNDRICNLQPKSFPKLAAVGHVQRGFVHLIQDIADLLELLIFSRLSELK